MTESERFDMSALRAGVSITLVMAVPFQIAALVLRAHNDKSSWLLPLTLLVLLGFFIGAGVAAWVQQRRTPLTHGIVTAAGTFITVEVIAIVIRLIRGSSVRWFADAFTLTATVVVGLAGGLVGMKLQEHGYAPKR